LSEEQVLQERSLRPRLFQLDSLRGLAAVTVVWNHILLGMSGSPKRWMVELISDGRAAVVLFFVLSGYVLSLPYWSGRSQPYGLYLLRRICRIYLPFAAAAVLSIFCAYQFRHSSLVLNSYFNQTWHTPITSGIVVRQFLMVPMNVFNTAFWSLTYEMQMSVVMPLVCLVMRRTNPALFTLAFGLLVFAHPMNPYRTPQYPVLTYQITFLFVLGAALAHYANFLRKACEAMNHWLWALLAVSGCLYYFTILLERGVPLGNALGMRIFLINGLGAAGIILCSLHLQPIARVLKHSLPEYLGRISYSLYLVHGTVLFALVDLLWGHMRLRWLGGLIFVAAFVVAHLFCIAVEEPSMRLGKWLCVGAKRSGSAERTSA
jgi:peptidoglycan/LPS O-acetylase OafA/YrhL